MRSDSGTKGWGHGKWRKVNRGIEVGIGKGFGLGLGKLWIVKRKLEVERGLGVRLGKVEMCKWWNER